LPSFSPEHARIALFGLLNFATTGLFRAVEKYKREKYSEAAKDAAFSALVSVSYILAIYGESVGLY